MIIVCFDAGLGNQMLQFATYLALQQRYPGTRVVADIRKYNIVQIHNGLEIERLFPIRLDILYGKRTNKVSAIGRYGHFLMRKLTLSYFKLAAKRFCIIKDSGVLNEELFHLDPNKNYYLQGQWGNEKYFENVKAELLQRFRFKIDLNAPVEALAREISMQNAVSVHIRRGDYIGKDSVFTDLTQQDYYPAAFQHISKTVVNPVFYIFSDDPAWTSKQYDWLAKYEHRFVEGNRGNDSYRDMQLMSLCKHNIIANSTFSWWGGWLNQYPGKTVICPRHLFHDTVLNNKIVLEFYPPSWLKM
ncbi:MAG TPA: alpha-1,2-fucosyltransferase [Chitinophagaceae bacterium]|nr:alpha-1,2-fucosyltransferase [Chitinophagaceae bacterium]